MRNIARVGLGVIIENGDGQVLFGKRTGSHAPYYSIPGGYLELGESFEDGAIREVREEHGIIIVNPEIIAVTNNLKTYREEGLHVASIILVARAFEGVPTICEPDKCEEILWADPHNVRQPHFAASELAIRCYLEGVPYIGHRE